MGYDIDRMVHLSEKRLHHTLTKSNSSHNLPTPESTTVGDKKSNGSIDAVLLVLLGRLR